MSWHLCLWWNKLDSPLFHLVRYTLLLIVDLISLWQSRVGVRKSVHINSVHHGRPQWLGDHQKNLQPTTKCTILTDHVESTFRAGGKKRSLLHSNLTWTKSFDAQDVTMQISVVVFLVTRLADTPFITSK